MSTKVVKDTPPPAPTKKEKEQQLKDLEVGDCFRFAGGISFEDAWIKNTKEDFFYVTAPNGPKPAEDKVPCLTFDMKLYRHLDRDRLVIKHNLRVAILPADTVDIQVVDTLKEQSDLK